MIRWNKLVVYFFTIAGCWFPAVSQNLYDSVHTAQFAEYLFQTGQYDYAIGEYERLVHLNPSNTDATFRLVRSCRMGKKYQTGIQRAEELYSESLNAMPFNLACEYIQLLLLSDSSDKAMKYTMKNTVLPDTVKECYRLGIYLVQRKWNEALGVVQQQSNAQIPDFYKLSGLAAQALQIRYKSPALAACLSAVIPGSGKVYAGYWKDGLIAFLFVSTNVFHAYRGFHKYGSKSAYGWIFGSLAVCFYSGNIYGSHKAARRYNDKKENEIVLKAEDIIFNQY